MSFNYGCTTSEEWMFEVDDFENLDRTRYEFRTRNDKKLVGYLYFDKLEYSFNQIIPALQGYFNTQPVSKAWLFGSSMTTRASP